MLLSLKREIWTPHTTTSRLWVDDSWQCYVLEDRCRAKGVKIPKETAIPYGTYELVMDWSEKFKRIMPHIMDVPMFTGIRMHTGNDELDTEGCPIVGMTLAIDKVLDSKIAFAPFYAKLMQHVGYDVERAADFAYWQGLQKKQAPDHGSKMAIVIWSDKGEYSLP